MAWAQVTGGQNLSLSGRIKPSCLGGWMVVTTNTPTFIPTGADCPTAGEVVVTAGGNSVKVVYASDFKVIIYYNDTLAQTYNICEEVADLCTP
jgi:hypothetical protein